VAFDRLIFGNGFHEFLGVAVGSCCERSNYQLNSGLTDE
jgi:hypothetical protein